MVKFALNIEYNQIIITNTHMYIHTYIHSDGAAMYHVYMSCLQTCSIVQARQVLISLQHLLDVRLHDVDHLQTRGGLATSAMIPSEHDCGCSV